MVAGGFTGVTKKIILNNRMSQGCHGNEDRQKKGY
jgi:hypothetical protein